MRDYCSKCKKYRKGCPGSGADWYPLSIIGFCRDQVFWLIQFLDMLREGLYPPDPRGTGYTETPFGSKSRSSHAPFETSCQIAAELDIRIKACGIEGKLLKAEVKAGYTWLELSPESKSALNYCSGWRRRRQPYIIWKKQRTYRRKMTTKT